METDAEIVLPLDCLRIERSVPSFSQKLLQFVDEVIGFDAANPRTMWEGVSKSSIFRKGGVSTIILDHRWPRFQLTMRKPYPLLHQSPELASDSNIHIDYIREASALGAERIYHYHAVPTAFKGIEPYIALSNFVMTESSQSEKTPKITIRASQSVSICEPSSTQQIGNAESQIM